MKLRQGVCQGKKYWYRSDDKFIGQRIALGKYEPYLTKMILDRVMKDSVVIDVGANIGYYTVLLADKSKNVYSFEPEKDNFEILKKNVLENDLKNVKLFNLAVGSRKEKKEIFGSGENYGDYRLFGNNCSGGPHTAPLIKVDKLDNLVKDRVDLIKIDTQGWEPEVIEGAKKIISRWHPAIFFEWSPQMYKGAGLDYQKMWNFLVSEYGKIYYIDEYIQVYYPVNGRNKECNMWVGESSWWEQYRDFWPKKWLKRMLGKPAT